MRKYFSAFLFLLLCLLFVSCNKNTPSKTVTFESFSADKKDILVGSKTEVVFSAKIVCEEQIDEIYLYQGDKKIGTLPADSQNGTFSGTIKLLHEEEDHIEYYAKFGDTCSEPVTIFFYTELTEEDFAILNQVNAELYEVQKLYTDAEGYVAQESIPSLFDDICSQLDTHMEDGSVESYNADETSIYIKFSSGIPFLFIPTQKDVLSSGTTGEIITLAPAASSFGVQTTYDFFIELHKKIDNLEYQGSYDVSSCADLITAEFGAYNYQTHIQDDEVTIDAVKTLGLGALKEGVLLWEGHGGHNEEVGSALVTGEKATYENNVHKYSADLKEERIVTTGGWYTLGTDFLFCNYAVTSKFIDTFTDNSLKDCLIYLGTCSSGVDSRLADSFINKGASVVFASTGVIGMEFEILTRTTILYNMCKQDDTGSYYTAGEAYSMAQGLIGPYDPANKGTYVTYFGDGSFRFSSAKSSNENTEKEEPLIVKITEEETTEVPSDQPIDTSDIETEMETETKTETETETEIISVESSESAENTVILASQDTIHGTYTASVTVDGNSRSATWTSVLEDWPAMQNIYEKTYSLDDGTERVISAYFTEDTQSILLKLDIQNVKDGMPYSSRSFSLMDPSMQSRCYCLIQGDYLIVITKQEKNEGWYDGYLYLSYDPSTNHPSLESQWNYTENVHVYSLSGDSGTVLSIERDLNSDTEHCTIQTEDSTWLYASGFDSVEYKGAVYLSTEQEFCDKANELLQEYCGNRINCTRTSWENRWYRLEIDEGEIPDNMLKVDASCSYGQLGSDGIVTSDIEFHINAASEAPVELPDEGADTPIVYHAPETEQDDTVMPAYIPDSVDASQLQDLSSFPINGYWHSTDNRYVYRLDPSNFYSSLSYVDLNGKGKMKFGSIIQTSSYSVNLKSHEDNGVCFEVFASNGQLISDEITFVRTDDYIVNNLLGTWQVGNAEYEFTAEGDYYVTSEKDSYWGSYFVIDESYIVLGETVNDYELYNYQTDGNTLTLKKEVSAYE